MSEEFCFHVEMIAGAAPQMRQVELAIAQLVKTQSGSPTPRLPLEELPLPLLPPLPPLLSLPLQA
jgi:hypothetical protein